MILKMEKLSVFGLLRDKDAVVSALMKKRCVQIRSPEVMDGFEEMGAITRTCGSDAYALEQRLSRFSAALGGVSPYSKKAGIFTKKPRVSYDRLEDMELLEQAEGLCARIEKTLGEISDLRSAKNKDQFQLASMEPWAGLDLPIDLTGTRTAAVTHYLLPGKTDEQSLRQAVGEQAPASVLQMAGADREQLYLLTICHRSQEDELWQVLKEFGAAKATFPGVTGTAAAIIQGCNDRIVQADGRIAELEEELGELAADTYPLKYAVDVLSVQIQREKLGGEMLRTREAFCFTAWVPEVLKAQVIEILDRFGCFYQWQECGREEEAPILLKNNPWSRNYEAVTNMYSPPAYHGFDPNGFVSIFYFIFFGMMLSDAGFGLVLFFGGLWLKKKMDLGENARKLTTVISMGGLSAVIWGAIFGSWFGDLIPVIADVFFGKTVVIPYLIDPLTDALTVMGMSLAFGFVHIIIGMLIKGYMLIGRGQVLDAVFDVGFWVLALVGLAMMLCAGLFLGTGTLFQVGVALAVIGAVGLILTQGRSNKNPIMRILSGITSLYDVTGYFSDILSYSRILALGLATGVIAQVVNMMGTMPGGSFIGAIVFIVVFIAGSALNLGINTLGAYVHTARLQYVEFFGKFYEPGGRMFDPVAAQTKYIVVTNEEEQ